jgi:preprotein translocase SecE subunit
MKDFFANRIAELNAVTWPTQNYAIHSTIVVVSIMALLGVFITASDTLFGQLVDQFILN